MKMLSRVNSIKVIAGACGALAIYFFLSGTIFPGGGFAGGIMLAAAYVSVSLMPGQEKLNTSLTAGRLLALTGAGTFIYLLLSLLGAGSQGAGSFLGDAFAGQKTLSAILLNSAIALSFGGGISCLINIFSAYKPPEALK
jgi:multicomponent Na+:H+ antiporter subunit B